MNRQMFDLMMQQLGSQMLPPPSTYNPAAQPLFGAPKPVDPNAPKNTQAMFAGKGGGK